VGVRRQWRGAPLHRPWAIPRVPRDGRADAPRAALPASLPGAPHVGALGRRHREAAVAAGAAGASAREWRRGGRGHAQRIAGVRTPPVGTPPVGTPPVGTPLRGVLLQSSNSKDGSGSRPYPVYSFTQVTSDQMRGMLTFSMETGVRRACARNAGRSRSDLKPMCTVIGEITRSAFDRSRF